MSKTKPAVRSREERDELVLKNVRLVSYIATLLCKKFTTVSALGMDDVMQMGYIQLIRAAELWEEGKGSNFSTYACRAMQNTICREALRASRKASRICSTAYADGNDMDVPEEEGGDFLVEEEKNAAVHKILKMVPERSRQIIWYRVAEGWTFVELAKRFRISKQRLRVLCGEILERLREKTAEEGYDWLRYEDNDKWSA